MPKPFFETPSRGHATPLRRSRRFMASEDSARAASFAKKRRSGRDDKPRHRSGASMLSGLRYPVRVREEVRDRDGATMHSPKALGLEDGGRCCGSPGDGRRSRFPAVWLADNRPRPGGPEGRDWLTRWNCRDRQPRSATIAGSVEIAFACFDRPSRFRRDWLRDHASIRLARRTRREPKLWMRSAQRIFQARPTMR